MILELAKTGTWSGKKLTKSMISDIAGSFADPVPVIVGHFAAVWSDDAPAVGWIDGVEVKGNSLNGNVKLNAEGLALWESKKYRTWSVGLSKNDADDSWSLRHLALLGATNPAIKGLKVLEFSEGMPKERMAFINFSESEEPNMETKELETKLKAEYAEIETKLKADFKASQDLKDAEILQLRTDANTARKAEFSARIEATFKAGEGKVPVEKLKDIKALFAKENATISEILDGVNALFAGMPPMVTAGRIFGAGANSEKTVTINDLKAAV